MKKIYIIPGFGEDCFEPQYKKLIKALEKKGYEAVGINPNWYKPITEQTFQIEPEAMLFGFSFGAVIAYLIARKYPCKKLILASFSPIHSFTHKELVEDATHHMSKEMAVALADDIKRIVVDLSEIQAPYITMAGDREKLGNVHRWVANAGHRINSNYITAILKVVV